MKLSQARDARADRNLASGLREILQGFLRIPSVSGNEGEFTRHVQGVARELGFETDLWETVDEPTMPRHIPLKGRPTLVIKLAGRGGGRSLIFNAHADVVAAPGEQRWKFSPWSGYIENGMIYGRGACDVKGPLVSALGAMMLIKEEHPDGLAGDVLLELVPGEEDCVGLGTMTSITRGYRADGAIVLEPTENQPRCASRGGLRFEITATGRAVHGTVKWTGKDAILMIRHCLDALERIEARWNEKSDAQFLRYPIARPVTVDLVNGGGVQGMVCDKCICAGYLELLPSDELSVMKQRFIAELKAELSATGVDPSAIGVVFSEEYAGNATSADHPLCTIAENVVKENARWQGWYGFNSGCEAGVRANVHQTPTLVWGPGTLERAHAVDERIELSEVQTAALMFAAFAQRWCSGE
jgi:acetylornithine deacetylase